MESKRVSLLPCAAAADLAALGEIKAAFADVPSLQSWAVVLLSRDIPGVQVDSSRLPCPQQPEHLQ